MISTLVICHHCFQDRTSEYKLFRQVCGHLQLYGRNVRNRVETQNGRVLRRNRRHIRGVESEKKTVRCECDSPNTPTVCGSPETPTVCDSRKVRFEDENRKTQPTVHNYRQRLSGPEANSDVPLHVTRSPAVMDRDGQYKTRIWRYSYIWVPPK